jgi:predicted AAA+ superfamily ATPase
MFALDEQALQQFLVDFEFKDPMPEALAARLELLLAKYQVVGGMPEAVQRYLETDSFLDTRLVQESIVKSYVNDFARHAPRDEVAEILEVWQVIPTMLAKENKKFVFSEIRKGGRLEKYTRAITWLIQAGVLFPSRRLSNPRSPLAAQVDSKFFKLYHNDVGLLAARLNIDTSLVTATENLLGEYSGALAENFVAQELSAQGISNLYYWASKGDAEVDFILETPKKIVPLEVKARRNISSRSLTSYIQKYQPELALRASLKNFDRQRSIVNLPLYLVSSINTLLRKH